MASCRNVIIFIGLIILTSACSGSKSVPVKTKGEIRKSLEKTTDPENVEIAEPLDFDLEKYRSSLSDPSSQKSNALPNSFVVDDIKESIQNMNSDVGYRIQLISTSDRTKAQKVVADFNDWIFQNEAITYKAETYIIFKQPNYRVHIGDFKTRIQANEFIKAVKRRFSDAWIIQDTIIEDRSPDNVN